MAARSVEKVLFENGVLAKALRAGLVYVYDELRGCQYVCGGTQERKEIEINIFVMHRHERGSSLHITHYFHVPPLLKHIRF